MRKALIALSLLVIIIGLAFWLAHPARVADIDSFAACVKAGFPVSDTNPPTCDDGHQTYTGPLGSPGPSAQPLETLDYSILVEGDSKGAYPAKNQLITTQAQWQSFWREVHTGLPSTPPLIPVDFGKYSVIALTMGPEPTQSYSIRMLSIGRSAQATVVDVELREPAQDCKLPALKTDPYFLAQVPKLDQPPRFETSTATRSCSVP